MSGWLEVQNSWSSLLKWMMRWPREKVKKRRLQKSFEDIQILRMLKQLTIVLFKNGKFQTGSKSNQLTKMKKKWTSLILENVKEQLFTTWIT
jgi:hypothetical protein